MTPAGQPVRRPWKVVSGDHRDLLSVRAPSYVDHLTLRGPRIQSLRGIERFANVKLLQFEHLARTDDLSELRKLPKLRELHVGMGPTIVPAGSCVDFKHLLQISGLTELAILLYDEEDARAAATARFDWLPGLRSLTLLTPGLVDLGMDVDAAWVSELPELEHVVFGNFGIRAEATEAVCRASPRLRHLSFVERSPEQTKRIVEALGSDVVDTWMPPDRWHGEIMDVGDEWQVSLGFPGEASGVDQQLHAERLLRQEWHDLAGALKMDAGGDEVWFSSGSRETLEELVRRARKVGVL